MSLIVALTSFILAMPVANAVFIGLIPANWNRNITNWLHLSGLTLVFLATLFLAKIVLAANLSYGFTLYNWANLCELNLTLDQLAIVMMLLINFISLLVNFYAIGYMRQDPGYKRFYCYMSLFIFFMLLIVLASNFFLLFLGWEGVSLISYLLISFWFAKDAVVHAGYKAFLINRISDLGLLLGIAAVFYASGSLDYSALFTLAPQLPQATTNLICLLLLIGIIGKSAQMPLHIWLPDAMSGPIPVSALIHSATMVAAGVYLAVRLMPLYALSPVAQNTILIIGTCSALLMAVLALTEFDIKRILAYSTISQLGYMFAAIGVLAPIPAMAHLINHACFKALLFLAVGVVVMTLKGATDLREINKNKRLNLLVFITFLVGALALIGIPPFSGFFSKDAILTALMNSSESKFYFVALLAGVFVTALYIFRAFFLGVVGGKKSSQKTSPFLLIPLIILTFFVILLGFFVANSWLFLQQNWFGFGTLTGVLGVVCAWLIYTKYPNALAPLTKLHSYGFEAAYHFLGKKTSMWFGYVLNKYVETNALNRFIVDGFGHRITKISERLRRLHSGYIYHYVLLMGGGLILMLIIAIRFYA